MHQGILLSSPPPAVSALPNATPVKLAGADAGADALRSSGPVHLAKGEGDMSLDGSRESLTAALGVLDICVCYSIMPPESVRCLVDTLCLLVK